MTLSEKTSLGISLRTHVVRRLLACISLLTGFCASSPVFGVDLGDVLTKAFRPEAEIDLSSPGLEQAAELLKAGDTRGCRKLIIEYFSMHGPAGSFERWPAHRDAAARADSFLNDTYMLGDYPAYALPHDPSWTENPPRLENWQFSFLSFDILRNVNEAYRLTGDARYIEKAKGLIVDFAIDNVKPEKFPSPYSWFDHSVAMRAILFVDFFRLWMRLEERDDSFVQRYMELIWRHARFLASDRCYAKSTNHGIYANIALYRLSLAFPQFREAGRWKQLAVFRMEQQTKDNYSVEGIHREYSPSYHLLTAGLLEQFLADCSADADTRLSEEFISAVARIRGNIPYLFHPDGSLSLIGDSQLTLARDIPNALSAQEPSLRYVQTDGKEGNAPGEDSKAFHDAQFFVMRSGWGRERPYREESYLIADFAAYGNAHQHRDYLSFELSARGFKWITDLGALTYNINDAKRSYITSGAAHNVVVPYAKTFRRITRPNARASQAAESRESNAADRLEARLEKIEKYSDVDAKIFEYKELLPQCTGKLEDKILLLLAYCYQEIKGEPEMADSYIGRILQKGPGSEYYEVAQQMLSTRAVAADDAVETPPEQKNGPADAQDADAIVISPGNDDVVLTSREAISASEPSSAASPANNSQKPVVGFWLTDPAYDYLEGYFAYNSSFEHARAILFIKPYFFLILDRLKAKEPCELKGLFHLLPEVTASENDTGYLLSAGDTMRCLVMRISYPDSTKWSIVKGQTKPEYQGWYSGVFGNFEAAPVIESSFAADSADYYLAHLFVPLGRDDVRKYDVDLADGHRWEPAAGKPLRLTIREPHCRTKVTFMPSSRFLDDKPSDSIQPPCVQVSRKRR